MRLINTSTFKLKEFFDANIPPYAILSHTWGNDEITFQMLESGKVDQTSVGWAKIRDCCNQAASDGLEWTWIDTSCIDKTNSTELSEAINSMFRWYKAAVQCYAYLSDVEDSAEFTKSRWFTRGWTLQELLAPDSVLFFDKSWKDFGTRASLSEDISTVTGIPRDVLRRSLGKEGFCVAQKMSWAARRSTTREEDCAYCLLGLFDVNMPMIYGEGLKGAFIRLQHEIMRQSDDHSLFAWTWPQQSWLQIERSGLLGSSPDYFVGCGGVKRAKDNSTYRFLYNSDYAMTNKGIHIELPLVQRSFFQDQTEQDGFVALLNCETDAGETIGIYLQQFGQSPTSQDFVRYHCHSLSKEQNTGPLLNGAAVSARRIYVKEPPDPDPAVSYSKNSVTINFWEVLLAGFFLAEAHPTDNISKEENTKYTFLLWDARDCKGLLFKHKVSGKRFAVVLGMRSDAVWADIELNLGMDETIKKVVQDYCYCELEDGNIHTREVLVKNDSIEKCGRRLEISRKASDWIRKVIAPNTVVKCVVKKRMRRENVYDAKISVSHL